MISVFWVGKLILCALLATEGVLASLDEDDLRYTYPSEFGGVYDSHVCISYYEFDCPILEGTVVNATFASIRREDCPALLDVSVEDCGLAKNAETSFADVSSKLTNEIFPLNRFYYLCRHCLPSANRYKFMDKASTSLIRFALHSTLEISDYNSGDAHFIVDFGVYPFDDSSCSHYNVTFPRITCSRKPPPKGGVNATADIVQKNPNVTFNLKTSPNPWIAVYDSASFQIFFRGMGLLFLYVGLYLAPRFAHSHWHVKGNTIPVVLLLLESASTTVIGVFYAVGGGSGRHLPGMFYMILGPAFLGVSFATSVLSGFWFWIASMKLKRLLSYDRDNDKWIRVGLCLAILCVLSECYYIYSIVDMKENFISAYAVFLTLAQVIIGIVYFFFTLRFVKEGKRASIKMSAGNSIMMGRMMMRKFRRMARLLRFSAACMIMVSVFSTIYSLSGSMYYGVWDPNNYGFVMGFGLLSRFGISYCQVEMCRKSKTKVADKMSESTHQGAQTAFSVTNAAESATTEGGGVELTTPQVLSHSN